VSAPKAEKNIEKASKKPKTMVVQSPRNEKKRQELERAVNPVFHTKDATFLGMKSSNEMIQKGRA